MNTHSDIDLAPYEQERDMLLGQRQGLLMQVASIEKRLGIAMLDRCPKCSSKIGGARSSAPNAPVRGTRHDGTRPE